MEVGGGHRARGVCCKEKPGLQTRPWRRSVFQEQEGGAHRAEKESGQRGRPGSSLEKKCSGSVRCSREGQLRRNHWGRLVAPGSVVSDAGASPSGFLWSHLGCCEGESGQHRPEGCCQVGPVNWEGARQPWGPSRVIWQVSVFCMCVCMGLVMWMKEGRWVLSGRAQLWGPCEGCFQAVFVCVCVHVCERVLTHTLPHTLWGQ